MKIIVRRREFICANYLCTMRRVAVIYKILGVIYEMQGREKFFDQISAFGKQIIVAAHGPFARVSIAKQECVGWRTSTSLLEEKWPRAVIIISEIEGIKPRFVGTLLNRRLIYWN